MISATLYFDHGKYGVDSMTISAESIDELREIAAFQVEKRKPEHYWSEDVTESVLNR